MEENVVNTVATETPAQETTPTQETQVTPTPSGEVVKETPKESPEKSSGKFVPLEALREERVKRQEMSRKAQEMEQRLKDIESKFSPKPAEEADPFAGMSPEEREQTEKFIDKFVAPRMMKQFSPFIQEVQNERLNKQITEAKSFADKVGINFDEKLPDVVDFLSRPENKGRLTAKEAILSLYSEEILDNTRSKVKETISQEMKELNEKKKLANTSIQQVNPNSVIQSDEMAMRNMSPQERIDHNIRKAMDLGRQGIKNPKVRTE